MALISRIARLFKADMHGILDQLEDPRAVLAQALRDMQSEIEKNEAQHREIQREIAQFEQRQRDTAKRTEEINSQIQLCIKNSDEALAKSAIRRRIETQKAGRAAEQHCESCKKRAAELEKRIADQTKQLAGIQEKFSFVSEGAVTAAADGAGVSACTAAVVTDEEVEIAFLSERERFESAATR